MHAADVEIVKATVYAYDMSPIIARFAKERGLTVAASTPYANELKRYFLLRFIQKRKYGMMGDVDKMWHAFILDSKRYTEFCEAAFGQYLHHSPAAGEETQDPAMSTLYVRFLIDYFRYYGSPPPAEIWPLSMELFGDCSDWQIIQAICEAPCMTNCTS